jgi:hypothetical protein
MGLALSMATTQTWMRPVCKWITVFRQPVPRLVSAYMYCIHSRPRDPLCGFSHFEVRNSTIRTFAAHWSNFAFRELLLHPSLRQMISSEKIPKSDIVWWSWKRLVGHDVEYLANEVGRAAFDALRQMIVEGRMFDVVGLVERFEDTCRLLDKHMPLPLLGQSYLDLAHNLTDSHGSTRWKTKEPMVEKVSHAEQDPIVQAFVSTDLIVYEAAVARFEHQLHS